MLGWYHQGYQLNQYLLDYSQYFQLDTTGGTGTQAVVIWGINGSWEEVIDVVFLDGTNTVQSNFEYLGINKVSAYLSGNTENNQGDIDLVGSLDGTIQARIETGHGTSENAFLFIQAGHTFLMESLYLEGLKLSGGSAPLFEYELDVYSNVSNTHYEIFTIHIDSAINTHLDIRNYFEQYLFHLKILHQ